MDLKVISHEVSSLAADGDDVEPACSRIDHHEAPKGCFLFFASNRVWTDQVDTESVPGFRLGFLGREFPTFGSLLGFLFFADSTSLVAVEDVCP